MLDDVLRYLRNWFVVDDGVHHGIFTVEGGSLELPFLRGGQYFRIIGSVFNDGVYRYPALELTDEIFGGAVWALAIPPAVTDLAQEIEEWQAKNGDAVASPYQSESFGGYSYTKSADATAWQDVYAARLARWRKL